MKEACPPPNRVRLQTKNDKTPPLTTGVHGSNSAGETVPETDKSSRNCGGPEWNGSKLDSNSKQNATMVVYQWT